MFNGNVFGDVFISAGGNITADAGDGIQAYNYGIGNISVNVGFNVNIQALTSATAPSGNAPYGIGAFNYGPGDIHVTTSSGDVINSGSSGINASNQSNSIAANQGAMVTVSTAGSIHSRSINNNNGALPSGITAGFLGGTSATPNLNVNGTVIVNNAANVIADAGYGISAYNYGNGDITVNSCGRNDRYRRSVWHLRPCRGCGRNRKYRCHPLQQRDGEFDIQLRHPRQQQ